MTALLQDLRFALRTLIKNPGFTFVATLSLGLGIGAVTSVYSIVSSVLVHPTPYPEPDRMVSLENIHLEDGQRWSVSYPMFLDWQERNEVFEHVSAYSGGSFILTGPEGPERVESAFITAAFFPLLRETPALGRTFLPEEDDYGNGQVAILSDRLWRSRFNARDDILGDGVTLDGKAFTVVGVLDPDFNFLTVGNADIWVPAASREWANERGSHWMNAMARLKPGVSREQAIDGMAVVAASMAEDFPDWNSKRGIGVTNFNEDVIGDMRLAVLVLFGAVAFVLLIACVNVANLLLARVAGRQKEVTIRVALGAGRARLIRQLLTESALLAMLGGSLGVLLSVWGNSYTISLLPEADAKFYVEYFRFGLNGEILAITAGISLLTAFVFGLIPALQASKPNLSETLKEGGGQASSGGKRHRILGALVVSEVALALVLLIGAGLMIQSFQNLQRVSPGFDPVNILTVSLGLPETAYPEDEQRVQFFRTLEERVSAIGAVEHVGAVTTLPFSNSNSNTIVWIEGRGKPVPGEEELGDIKGITPGYFEAMEIPLRRGRAFTPQDNDPDAPVVIINERMATYYWPEDDAIGKRFRRGTEDNPWMTIVGVVGDVRHRGFDQEVASTFYLPHAQNAYRYLTLALRTTGNPTQLGASIRQIVLELDPNQPLGTIQTMDEIIATSMWNKRFNTKLFTGLAIVALCLATIGVYGVINYSVSQRTHEIGIRMALGAQIGDVRALVVRQGLTLAAAGVLLGLPAAFGLTRLIGSLLYGVSPNDPLTFAGISALLLGVALLASYIPARRATRVDPMVALRYE